MLLIWFPIDCGCRLVGIIYFFFFLSPPHTGLFNLGVLSKLGHAIMVLESDIVYLFVPLMLVPILIDSENQGHRMLLVLAVFLTM